MQMALFVQQGIYTPVEAINCATLSSAEAVGLDDRIGSIEKGKIADLVLINESLLSDLKGLEKGVEMVFFGGEKV
jgi:imidazolonepropionase-like amidohydrolase